MALTPEEFHAHATAHGQLPLPPFVEWDVFPFEGAGMQVRPLVAPVPERPRRGEDPATCPHCPHRDEGIWLDEHWRLERVPDVGVPLLLALYPREHLDLADLPDERASELGLLAVHLARAVEALPHIARAHVTRFGDGSAHLHQLVWARPEGQPQLRGSCLMLWDDVLPRYPAEVADADAATVAAALAASHGGVA